MTGSKITPEATQLRRLLWHQINYLESHTAEIEGRQPEPRENGFSPLLPLNIDDVACGNEPPYATSWTDATFSLIRYECNMVHRVILRQRIAIDRKLIDLATVRRLVDERKREIEMKYLDPLDESVPIQRCAKIVGRLLTARFDAMLLHPYLDDDDDSALQREMENAYASPSLFPNLHKC